MEPLMPINVKKKNDSGKIVLLVIEMFFTLRKNGSFKN